MSTGPVDLSMIDKVFTRPELLSLEGLTSPINPQNIASVRTFLVDVLLFNKADIDKDKYHLMTFKSPTPSICIPAQYTIKQKFGKGPTPNLQCQIITHPFMHYIRRINLAYHTHCGPDT